MKGTIYNKVTGAIQHTVQASSREDILLQCSVGENLEAWLGDELSSSKWYFVNGQPTERKSLGLVFSPERTDSIDGYEDDTIRLAPGQVMTISNIPAGLELMYPEGRVVVDDGFIEWSCDTPGSYFFRFFTELEYEGVIFNAIVG